MKAKPTTLETKSKISTTPSDAATTAETGTTSDTTTTNNPDASVTTNSEPVFP
jgi:hypothetical protein